MDMYDMIILGGGAAGLSAGIYASRGDINVMLLEKDAPGGQLLLTDNIENYPGYEHIEGFELAQKFMQHAQKFGLNMQYEGAENIKVHDDHVEITTKNNVYKTKYLLAAVGSNPRKLGVPGEDKFRGKGVSYCATCDGAFFKDKDCIIVGGGDSALDEGIALTKFAKKVTIVHRKDEFRAEPYLIELAKNNDKIEFLMNNEVKEVRGNDKVDRVLLYDNKEDKEHEMPIDGVFVFIGYLPNSKVLEGQVDLEKGEVIVDNFMKSSNPRIYAAGDIRQGSVKQVAASGGDGVMATIQIMHKLRSEG
ncbi:thioredoxin-disulfide reductase [Patescibacteria group bacterium]